MGEQSVDVVKAAYEAFGRGDVAGVLGAMADDIEWHEAEGGPYGGVYHGGEAVAQNVFGPIIQDVADFAVTAEEFIASGDAVAVVVRYTGTGKAHRQAAEPPGRARLGCAQRQARAVPTVHGHRKVSARTSRPRSRMRSTSACAQRMARAGPSKVAKKPSPAVSRSSPRKRVSSSADDSMVTLKQFAPGTITELGRPLGRADDVREENRCQNAVGEPRERLLDDETRNFFGDLRRQEDVLVVHSRDTQRACRGNQVDYFWACRSAFGPARYMTSVGTRTAGRTSRRSVSIQARWSA